MMYSRLFHESLGIVIISPSRSSASPALVIADAFYSAMRLQVMLAMPFVQPRFASIFRLLLRAVPLLPPFMATFTFRRCTSDLSRRSAMRCFTARLQLLTFETLLCGSHGVLPPPARLAAACARAKEEFALQCSTSAPPPTKLTTAVVATHLLHNNLRDAAAVLASHPCQQQVLEEVRDYVRQHPGVFSVSTLTGMLEEARCVSPAAVATFLRAAVDEFLRGSSAASTVGDEATAWDAQRENLRSLVLRHIRFYPACVSFLLGSLCAVSRGCAGDREDVIEVMQIAMRERSMNPRDFGGVLDVVWKSREPRRVAMMWAWMQHTSACWDVRAASIAIMAFSELHQMDEAVACIQRLAEADGDPTIDAQVAFVRFLGVRTPSLLRYAAQLVLHWHPSGERLWRGEPQAVGMELVKICCACGERKWAVEMLEQMVATNASVPAELEAFMLRPGAAALGEHYSASVAASKTLQELFIDVPLRLPNLGEQPALVGLLLSLGMVTNRLPEVYDALEKASLTPANFQDALDCFVTGSVVKAASPVAVLACVREAGVRTGHKVPKEMESWLQLATEM
ncbi:conserved hypothetical protein [Leishmania major strain Friedlin]|uniref:Uncharacterized protein n=1 Tax=Leishmania major TaxID=5664 RepID=Q4QGT4_LEIMA|nr:conserved hypothetical protein [Leishmania major strain Friedlin]CAJ02397.1 conserved hypothetical protein [Leishmania major strain Friedlin]|eukprot:XP_001681614.1 conserved hypothetical protein [Leishmania major strain Friedlin]